MATKITFLKRNSVLLFIGFIILLIFASSLTAFYSRIGAAQHQQKKDALLKVRNSLERVWNYVNIADMSFRGYATIQDEKFLEPYSKAVEGHQRYLDSLSYYLSEQGYAKKELIAANEQSIKSYIDLVGNLIDLLKQDRREEALAIFKSDPGYEVWLTYDKFNRNVLEYINQLEENAQQRYDTIQLFTAAVQGMLLLMGVPILVLVISRLQNEKKTRQQLLSQLNNSSREFIYDDGHARNDQEPGEIIGYLTQNLEKVVGFIRNLGQEKSEWTELSDTQKERNEHTLVGELLKMQDKLDQIKQEDELRLWATEGEGKVAEIARTYQTDLTALGDHLLSYIIQYLKANQGGLFIINETDASEPYLEMVACYAYDKKKHQEKQIRVGQGLLGQAFLEQKVIRLNQIPDNYVHITSGLGEATPSYLAIIPLKFNEEVLGVLEIASFQALSDFEIGFLERIGEIIASSISLVRTNERTQKLLAQSREKTEEMQSQEEEMRQNLEELVATQEAASRSQEKVQAIFDSATDGIVMLTDQGQIEMFNPAAETIFGYPADEMQDQPFEKLLVLQSDSQEGDQIEATLTINELQTVEAQRKNGEVFSAELRMQESQVGNQRVLIGIIRDLTQDERQKANENLMRDRIQEIEQKAYERLTKLREKFKGQLAERDQQIEELKASSSPDS